MNGREDFREAVRDFYARRFDVALDPEREVIPAIGAKEAIFNLNLAFLDPGDYALAADPGYPVYTGGPWLAGEGPGNHLSHHWGSLVAIDGQVTIPQRYAIDWFGLDAAGHALRPASGPVNKTTDADWIGFGAYVLAVADGVVRDARDGVADGVPLAPQVQPDDLTARTVYGNFVVLEIAPNVFAHYAHLRNGSVRPVANETS